MARSQISASAPPSWTRLCDNGQDDLLHDDDVPTASLLRNAEDEVDVADDGQDDADCRQGATSSRREQWNSPRINMYRYCGVNLSFFVMGMHDGCIGVENYYDINHTTVSTIFILPFLGYVTAALSNDWVHYQVGQRGIAFLGPLFRLIGYVSIVFCPPFPLLPILFMFTGFGSGIEDSAYNAWVGNMHQTNELLGIIHGTFGLGATVSPIISSTMVAKLKMPWYSFYYIFILVVCVELAFGLWAFWGATGAAHRERLRQGGSDEGARTATVLREPVTWLVAIFLLLYAGVEVSLGGWIPTFMMEERHADGLLAGVTATLFWLGLSLGRIILGFVTGRVGERFAITAYLVLCVAFQLAYWLIPTTVGAISFVSLLGFFLGPLFPAAIVVLTQILPAEYHVSAIGFSSAVGGGGAAVLPFAGSGLVCGGEHEGGLVPVWKDDEKMTSRLLLRM
ncbi:Major facilitator superfamily domain, general substrate transporter [Metarhizium album ARSEF 1941]|uniref:Major facilitator superfamily domain, general substrate transporter n=1 Tax=Metarhizium album (strain ARSEF 1941) TaxID=1081103 RepID=A0A0B2WWN1_METAS|nr:Major facilitator superfamily domain, general substrate transporter [Metarhizium album ARSEF 1941]KHN97827.1 Major facilitator superfamily domain, general substrate transporter [Metarhizium album ARSEF 1941]